MHVFRFREFGLKTPIQAPKLEVFRGKIGEGVGRYWPPTNSFLLLGVYTSVSNLVKIDKEMRPWECPQMTDTHTHTHTRSDAKRFNYLSHAICYSYGADKNMLNRSPAYYFVMFSINAICFKRLSTQKQLNQADHRVKTGLRETWIKWFRTYIHRSMSTKRHCVSMICLYYRHY